MTSYEYPNEDEDAGRDQVAFDQYPGKSGSQRVERETLIAAGRFPLSKSSSGTVVSLLVKSGGGTLLGLTGFNVGVATQYVLIFDSITAPPASGANPAVAPLPVPTVNAFAADWGDDGRRFFAGIVVAWSTATTFTAGTAGFFDVQSI